MSKTVAIDLPSEPESARRAREQVNAFRGSVDESTFIDLRLLVDELVVEAIRGSQETRGGGSQDGRPPSNIEFRAELDGGQIHIVITEGGDAYRLPSRRPEPGDPGFGLHLVQRLSDRWGIRRERNRATVWLELLQAAPPAA